MQRATQVVERLKGPVVPINICFGQDDSVHYAAIRKYVNWLCEEKVPVLLLTYGSSEYGSLTDDEIWRLTAELAEEIAGRSLFITATGWWWPGECREFLKHADEVGADVVMIQTDHHLEMNREVLLGYYDRVQDAAPIPLMLYNPGTPEVFPVSVAAELAKRPQIVGIKNDGEAFGFYYDLIRSTIDEDFGVVSGGMMRNFIYGYPAGSTAYLCPIAPFLPSIALEFYHLLVAEQYQKAWEMIFRYEDSFIRIVDELAWLPSIKSAINLYGLYPNDRMRSPRVSHTDKEREELRQGLESVFGPVKKVKL